jgi:hypothetical protein
MPSGAPPLTGKDPSTCRAFRANARLRAGGHPARRGTPRTQYPGLIPCLLRLARRRWQAPNRHAHARRLRRQAAKRSMRRRTASRFRAPTRPGNDMRRIRSIARGSRRGTARGTNPIGSRSTRENAAGARRGKPGQMGGPTGGCGGAGRDTDSRRRISSACWRARTVSARPARPGRSSHSASIIATPPARCAACSAASATPGWDASTTARRSCTRPPPTCSGMGRGGARLASGGRAGAPRAHLEGLAARPGDAGPGPWRVCAIWR